MARPCIFFQNIGKSWRNVKGEGGHKIKRRCAPFSILLLQRNTRRLFCRVFGPKPEVMNATLLSAAAASSDILSAERGSCLFLMNAAHWPKSKFRIKMCVSFRENSLPAAKLCVSNFYIWISFFFANYGCATIFQCQYTFFCPSHLHHRVVPWETMTATTVKAAVHFRKFTTSFKIYYKNPSF